MRSYTPIPCLLFLGCGFGLQPLTPAGLEALVTEADTDADADTDSDSDSDTDSDTDSDSDTIPEIESIDPNWGTTAGGIEVTLYGTFDKDASVRVGGNEADLVSVSPNMGELVFITPESDSEGVVSVVLDSSGETAKLDEGFTYFLDGTGSIGLVGQVSWVDMVGTYWNGATTDTGYGFIVPIEPGDFDWGKTYAGALDTCESSLGSYEYLADVWTYDAGSGSSITLEGGGKSIRMPWNNSAAQFEDTTLTAAQVGPGSTYDLTELDLTNDPFPEYTASAVLSIPAAFTVTTPPIMGANPPMVSKNFSLSWSGGSTADGVFVTLGLYNTAGDAYQETVSCHLRDDGAFNIPSTAWVGSWPVSRQLNIYVSRYNVDSGVIPYNNAGTAVMGEYVLYGAAFTK